jgi:hypothetical protein
MGSLLAFRISFDRRARISGTHAADTVSGSVRSPHALIAYMAANGVFGKFIVQHSIF